MLASALLHDVCEDCGVKPEELSSSSAMRAAVSLLTKDPEHLQEAGCAAAPAKYYNGIHGNQMAMLIECLDRCSNLSTKAFSFSVVS